VNRTPDLRAGARRLDRLRGHPGFPRFPYLEGQICLRRPAAMPRICGPEGIAALFCPRPSFEEAGNFDTGDFGWRCAQPTLARGELSRLGGHDRYFAHRAWWKRPCALLDTLSEAFAGICNPAQCQLACAFIHLPGASGQAIFARGEVSRLGGQGRLAHRACWKLSWLFLGLSSEALIGICDPTQYVLGYAFIHLLGPSEHLFCTAVPMPRIVVGHA
jgi:hypothetical protein